MSRAITIASLLVFALAFGCKDEQSTGGEPVAATKTAVASAKAPTQAEVDAVDCAKACKAQRDCIRNSGLKVEDHTAECTKSCEGSKSIYDPDMFGETWTALISYAAGECE